MATERRKAWVQDRPGRSLTVEWHDPATGRRRQLSANTDDYAVAERLRASVEARLDAGVPIEVGRTGATAWQAARQRYAAEHLAQLRARSREKSTMVLDLFERWAKPKALAAVTEGVLSRWNAAMLEQPLAPWTRRNYLVALRGFLQWAVGQRLLPAVPAFPTVPVPQRRPQPISAEDAERLLAAETDPAWRAWLLCAWMAGLRLSEALELRRSPRADLPWVDFAGGRLVLPASFTKAGEDQAVPLHPALRAAIEPLPPGPDGRAFDLKRRDGSPADRHCAGKRVRAAAWRAGVALTTHDLRRGFGCRLAVAVPAAVLQAAMRHANIGTTMRFYATGETAVAAAVAALPAPGDVAPDVAQAGKPARKRPGKAAD